LELFARDSNSAKKIGKHSGGWESEKEDQQRFETITSLGDNFQEEIRGAIGVCSLIWATILVAARVALDGEGLTCS
jgi:hypothetical protein